MRKLRAAPGEESGGKPLIVTAVTVKTGSGIYPGIVRYLLRPLILESGRADTWDKGEAMSLGTLAITGLVAAVVLIVVAITLINKFAA